MLDYLTAQRLTPRHIYREVRISRITLNLNLNNTLQIVTYIQAQPRGFAPLVELDMFSDLHGVAADTDPIPNAPHNNICRLCATEVLLFGLRDWWIRERQKGFLEEAVMNRKDCPDGSLCDRQRDLGTLLRPI